MTEQAISPLRNESSPASLNSGVARERKPVLPGRSARREERVRSVACDPPAEAPAIPGEIIPEWWAISSRNAGRNYLRMGGRHHSGIMGGLAPESADEARFRSRWVCGVRVWLTLRPDRVVFRHDGLPFNYKNIAHLIYHGTTKYEPSGSGVDPIGQYAPASSRPIWSRRPCERY
jgi:hypothetical protein